MHREYVRAAVYSRKSKITGMGESIASQRQMCKGYIAAFYGQKAADNISFYEDEGFSGKNLNRPAFKRLIEDTKSGKIDVVVVYRLDRISRSIGDFSRLIEDLTAAGIGFVSVKEQFDTNTPMGRAMMYIASVFSQLERETIGERIRDNMMSLAKTGRWLGGVTPLGYTARSQGYTDQNGRKKKISQLVIEPTQRRQVKKIFTLYERYQNFWQTVGRLESRGIKTKKGNSFTPAAVKSILRNPVYSAADKASYSYFAKHESILCGAFSDYDGKKGIMAYNRTHQEKGKAPVYMPVSRWVVAPGEHRPIVRGAQWVKVQRILDSKSRKGDF